MGGAASRATITDKLCWGRTDVSYWKVRCPWLATGCSIHKMASQRSSICRRWLSRYRFWAPIDAIQATSRRAWACAMYSRIVHSTRDARRDTRRNVGFVRIEGRDLCRPGHGIRLNCSRYEAAWACWNRRGAGARPEEPWSIRRERARRHRPNSRLCRQLPMISIPQVIELFSNRKKKPTKELTISASHSLGSACGLFPTGAVMRGSHPDSCPRLGCGSENVRSASGAVWWFSASLRLAGAGRRRAAAQT